MGIIAHSLGAFLFALGADTAPDPQGIQEEGISWFPTKGSRKNAFKWTSPGARADTSRPRASSLRRFGPHDLFGQHLARFIRTARARRETQCRPEASAAPLDGWTAPVISTGCSGRRPGGHKSAAWPAARGRNCGVVIKAGVNWTRPEIASLESGRVSNRDIICALWTGAFCLPALPGSRTRVVASLPNNS